MSKVPMTAMGVELLNKELFRLKTEDRPKVIAAIAEAREHGDLKENAEYHAAKEQQGFVEGRIREIESKLASAQIIDVSVMENTGRVVFGATVTLLNLETDELLKYTIVGDDEADLEQRKVSYASPIARAIMGKVEGDVVVVRAPKGDVEYEIAEVVYQ